MRKLGVVAAVVVALVAAAPALAQQSVLPGYQFCSNSSGVRMCSWIPVDASHPLPTSGGGTVAVPNVVGGSLGGVATVEPMTANGFLVDEAVGSQFHADFVAPPNLGGVALPWGGSANGGSYGAGWVDLKNLNGTALVGVDPCALQAKTTVPITITSATQTTLVAAVAAKRVYVCSLGAITGLANNVNFYAVGSAGACSSAATEGVLGANSNTATNGFNLAANGGLTLGNGEGTVASTIASNATLCVVTSSNGPLAGALSYVQQ